MADGDSLFGGMAMVDASLILDAVVAVSIAAGAFFAVWELRSMARDRRTDLMMRCVGTYCTREFEGALSKVMSSTASDPEILEREISIVDLVMVCDFIEAVSYLARRDLIDRKMIVEYFAFFLFWRKLHPWVVALRERTGESDLYSDFEWLAKLQETRAE